MSHAIESQEGMARVRECDLKGIRAIVYDELAPLLQNNKALSVEIITILHRRLLPLVLLLVAFEEGPPLTPQERIYEQAAMDIGQALKGSYEAMMRVMEGKA